MNILISGGTGFIGTEIRNNFLKKGDFLTIITRSPEKYASETAKNQAFIDWDSDLSAVMEEADVVINLVGESIFGKPWTEQIKKRLYSSRVDNTRKLVEAVEKSENRPELFISASGISYYGDRGDDILDESEPPGDRFLPQLCVDWEKAAQPVKGLGVRLVIFRNGIVLEKGGGAFQYLYPLFKLGLGGPVGDGSQYFPWVHMMDVCRVVEFVIENEEVEGIMNLVSPNPVTMKELTDTLGEVMHRPSFFRAPEFAVRFILGEAADPLLDSLRAQPKALQQAGFEFRFKSLKEALSDIV
ncbi:TIGR01777 family oxidoreductase [Aliifodinibius sp. S!AR15-10]|uniref:TIGR01777 family oxidoreductase n=1 Tax=Aliifodinibius sp. S!AR15-10 TaxID=2950437 RepID=UPI0028603FBB|nr:TIGR01777 family oxidoreductase [Aliifodinibius sp. S!AR15-10]MDR8393099.1 TIGR01777 family oxidoreductase [Aliifodinibius sp. S!AR15-10]